MKPILKGVILDRVHKSAVTMLMGFTGCIVAANIIQSYRLYAYFMPEHKEKVAAAKASLLDEGAFKED